MEWIEGKPLSEWVLDNDPYSAVIKIPEKIVTSLAEFVYNLTTCPIPREESKGSIDEVTDVLQCV